MSAPITGLGADLSFVSMFCVVWVFVLLVGFFFFPKKRVFCSFFFFSKRKFPKEQSL